MSKRWAAALAAAFVVLAFAVLLLVNTLVTLWPHPQHDHGNRPCTGRAAGVCYIGPVTRASN